MRIARMVLSGVLLVSLGSQADADTITIRASGQGWCIQESCNNTNPSALQNTFAGRHEEREYRDWFAFQLPAPRVITGATLNIWNDARNFTDHDAVTFALRDASTISFAGLLGSTTLGSVSVPAADAGASRFVAISLNSVAIDLLNGARGGQFLFGGVVSPFMSSGEVQIFGYTDGRPPAFLELSADPVPEPGTLLLFGAGSAALACRRRRRLSRGCPAAAPHDR